MSDLPGQLSPDGCDLRDFPFMPLEVDRLRRSKSWLVAKRAPELGFYMVNLWAASWHNLPAASVEDDDDVLADQAMCDPKRWPKVRDAVLRGWVKCSDGRLYHETVVELATEAWKRKSAFRHRTEAARSARAAARQTGNSNVTPMSGTTTVSVTDNVGSDDNVCGSGRQDRQGQGQGQGQGQKEEKPLASQARVSVAAKRVRKLVYSDAFEEWWAEYPRREGGKEEAFKSYEKAIQRGASPAELLIAIREKVWSDNPKFIPHATTWLNQGRWQDDPNASAPEAVDTEALYATINGAPPARASPFSGKTIDADPLQLWTPQ